MFKLPDISEISSGLAATDATMNAILVELQRANELLAQIAANTDPSRSSSQDI